MSNLLLNKTKIENGKYEITVGNEMLKFTYIVYKSGANNWVLTHKEAQPNNENYVTSKKTMKACISHATWIVGLNIRGMKQRSDEEYQERLRRETGDAWYHMTKHAVDASNNVETKDEEITTMCCECKKDVTVKESELSTENRCESCETKEEVKTPTYTRCCDGCGECFDCEEMTTKGHFDVCENCDDVYQVCEECGNLTHGSDMVTETHCCDCHCEDGCEGCGDSFAPLDGEGYCADCRKVYKDCGVCNETKHKSKFQTERVCISCHVEEEVKSEIEEGLVKKSPVYYMGDILECDNCKRHVERQDISPTDDGEYCCIHCAPSDEEEHSVMSEVKELANELSKFTPIEFTTGVGGMHVEVKETVDIKTDVNELRKIAAEHWGCNVSDIDYISCYNLIAHGKHTPESFRSELKNEKAIQAHYNGGLFSVVEYEGNTQHITHNDFFQLESIYQGRFVKRFKGEEITILFDKGASKSLYHIYFETTVEKENSEREELKAFQSDLQKIMVKHGIMVGETKLHKYATMIKGRE